VIDVHPVQRLETFFSILVGNVDFDECIAFAVILEVGLNPRLDVCVGRKTAKQTSLVYQALILV